MESAMDEQKTTAPERPEDDAEDRAPWAPEWWQLTNSAAISDKEAKERADFQRMRTARCA
jgi:hypothetical protein